MRVSVLALLLGLAPLCAFANEARLPHLKLDPTRTTISGISSGAYMAQQLHLAYSDHVAGAAFLAGGPWHCAQGSLSIALAQCMAPTADKGPDVDVLAAAAKDAAAAGQIAPLRGLVGDRVLVLHGKGDLTVAQSLSTASVALYRKIAPEAKLSEDLTRSFSHTFPTLDAGSACEVSAAPYIGRCGFDAAAEIFASLLGKPPRPADVAHGKLLRFDQRGYQGEGDAFLAGEGYVYIPDACARGERCGLHIALHGCQQNADTLGEKFVRDTGYNRWADVYSVVVLYPQTRASLAPLNPKGCWDWWGYSGATYDTRDGVQMRAVAAMAAALGAPLR